MVVQPVLETNQDHSVLYIAKTASPFSGRSFAEGIHLSSLQWTVDSREVFFVSENEAGTQIMRVQTSRDQLEQVTNIHGQLAQFWESPDYYSPYRLSPDGTIMLYAVYDAEGEKRDREARMHGGIVYDGVSYFNPKVDAAPVQAMPFELWSYDFGKKQSQRIWYTLAFQVLPPGFQFSPDGKKLAILYQSGDESHTLALLDWRSGEVSRLLTNLLGGSLQLNWSSDGESLLFMSAGIAGRGMSRGKYEPYAFEIATGKLRARVGSQSRIGSTLDAKGIESSVEKQTGDLLHNCSLDVNATHAACIREAPMVPPEVVSIAFSGAAPKGKTVVLTHLNPEYDVIQMGYVSALSWLGKKGNNGFPQAGLILPTNYIPGHRYPLVVMLYNLYSGRNFVAVPHEFNSYPAQAFAGHGYAVVLMNVPEGTWVYGEGNFEAAKASTVDGMVAAVRSATDLLVGQGIADRGRMGIMGWSYGGFWTDYIVTHYSDWFHAAASGDYGVNSPLTYLLAPDSGRSQERGFYGGGPFGKYLSRWQEIAPVLNVDRLRAPLLMEYTDAYLNGLAMRSAILDQGGQTELVIYPDDKHILLRPLNRYNSMMRHFDWFNFWLLGEEDPDPDKADQYARWHELRKLQEESRKGRTNPNSP